MCLDLARDFFALGQGGEYANIVEFRDRYYAAGSHMSAGDREYKSAADAYRNDVVALILVPLSERQLRADELPALLQRRPSPAEARQIVVIRNPDQGSCFGILVDELGEIPEIAAQRILQRLSGARLRPEVLSLGYQAG